MREGKRVEDFIQCVWKDEAGNRIILHELHHVWHDFITRKRAEGIDRIGILAPYKFGKTPNILGYALHEICRNRNLRCKIVCNDDMNAKKRLITIRRYIEYDRDFRALYGDYVKPNYRGIWTMNAMEVIRDSYSTDATVESAGVLTTGIGGTFDMVIFDDVCDLNNSILSPANRAKVREAVRELWLSRLEPEGFALYIGTPWHDEDALHMLLDTPNWAWLLMRVKQDYSGIEYVEYVNK